jgi:hypothetical protein
VILQQPLVDFVPQGFHFLAHCLCLGAVLPGCFVGCLGDRAHRAFDIAQAGAHLLGQSQERAKGGQKTHQGCGLETVGRASGGAVVVGNGS